jgi:hypothetical protein
MESGKEQALDPHFKGRGRGFQKMEMVGKGMEWEARAPG